MLLCCLLTACKHDDYTVVKQNETLRPAGDFLKNDFDYSLFYTALNYTGLIETLNGPGPFTVLAPNNTAFNQLGIQTPGDILKLNHDSLKQAMEYHILPYNLRTTDIPTNGVDVRYKTLTGDSLYASNATNSASGTAILSPQLYFNGNLISTPKDLTLANGTLQGISKVMKRYPGKTVQAWLAQRPNYSIFVSGLKKFGLWNELATHGPFTIFAPNNTVLTAGGMTQAVVDGLDTSKYIGPRLFGCYIIYNKFYFVADYTIFQVIGSETIVYNPVRNDGSTLKVSNGAISVFAPGSNPTANSYPWIYTVINNLATNVALTDNLCDNGLVHNLLGVLSKPATSTK